MRALAVVILLGGLGLSSARAQDAASCDKIFNASTDSGLQRFSDTDLDASLCTTSKAVLKATTTADKTLQDACTPAMSAVMREFMRRNRDSHAARAKCG